MDLLFSPNNESGELYELTVNLEREREKCKECINIVRINLNKLVAITNEFASPFKDLSSDFLLEKQNNLSEEMICKTWEQFENRLNEKNSIFWEYKNKLKDVFTAFNESFSYAIQVLKVCENNYDRVVKKYSGYRPFETFLKEIKDINKGVWGLWYIGRSVFNYIELLIDSAYDKAIKDISKIVKEGVNVTLQWYLSLVRNKWALMDKDSITSEHKEKELNKYIYDLGYNLKGLLSSVKNIRNSWELDLVDKICDDAFIEFKSEAGKIVDSNRDAENEVLA